MKRVLLMLAASGLASTWMGCQSATELTTPTSAGIADDSTTSSATLVSLKLPNMTWGGCAASVRGDLEKIVGVTDIQTDVGNRLCSFKVTGPDVDYQTPLAEFAKTNEKLAGYEIQ